MTSAWWLLGTMERISVGLPQLDTSPSATSTASLAHCFVSRCSTNYVARSYTPSLTFPSLWYHIHSIQPSYLRPSSLPYISIVVHPTQCSSLLTICPYQFRIISWTSIAISPTFGVSILYLSFMILSTFVTYHIHRSNFFYCAFCNVPAPILPLSCTAFPRIFTFIFCHPTLHRFLPILLTVLHAEGDFCIQFSIFFQRRSQIII